MPRTVICPGCGRELLSTLVICPECSTPVPQEARAAETLRDERPYAPPDERGYRQPYRWMNSAELPAQPASKPQAAPPPPYQPPARPVVQTEEPTQNLFCAGCGRGLPQLAAFCPQCGRPVQSSQPQPQPAQVFQPARPFNPLPAQKRTPGEQTTIALIAVIAAIIILMFFC